LYNSKDSLKKNCTDFS